MQAQLTQVEAAAAAARDKAVAQGLSDRMGALETQPSAMRLLLANHKLREAKTAKVWAQGGVHVLGQRWGRRRRRGCCRRKRGNPPCCPCRLSPVQLTAVSPFHMLPLRNCAHFRQGSNAPLRCLSGLYTTPFTDP